VSREPDDSIDCADFVELITDYLDEALPDAERARIDAHLLACQGCANALDQWRAVVKLSGRLSADDVDRLDPAVRAELLDAFRVTDPEQES
jgi:anti-sigma factor RsiW